LAQITGFEPPVTKAPRRPGDIYQTYFDYSKAERVLGWKPEVSFAEGVKITVDYFRQ
jgi:UDP-glucose 4-epimerase